MMDDLQSDHKEIIISVLMITYNHEKYIEEAINGILMQQGDFQRELLICNDTSTDNTKKIIESYIHNNISQVTISYYQHEENVGMMSNFIFGLKHCNGKYIALCDGDDYWTDPLKLQKQVYYLETNTDYSICFHKILILKDDHFHEDYITRVPAEITGQAELLRTNYIHTVSSVFRNIFTNFPVWFNSAMPGDYPLWLLLTSNGGKVKYIDEVMAIYRVHKNGIWSMQDGNNKYAQQIAITFLSCAREINIRDQQYLEWHVLSLAKSVSGKGYQHITRKGYLSIIIWVLMRIKLNKKQWLNVLRPLLA